MSEDPEDEDYKAIARLLGWVVIFAAVFWATFIHLALEKLGVI